MLSENKSRRKRKAKIQGVGRRGRGTSTSNNTAKVGHAERVTELQQRPEKAEGISQHLRTWGRMLRRQTVLRP